VIVFYTGVPGSYKTHDAVRRIIEYMIESKYRSYNHELKPSKYPPYSKQLVSNHKFNDSGVAPSVSLRHVYTNIRGFGVDEYKEILKSITGWTESDCEEYLHNLTDFEVKEHFGTIDLDQFVSDVDGIQVKNTNYQLVKGCLFKPNSVIAIDEVHTLFNCRDFQTTGNRAFTYFGTYHRHDNSHVLCITHLATKVDKQILDLIGISYVFEQILFFGNAGKKNYKRYMYRGADTVGKAVYGETLSINEGAINCYKTTKSGDVDSFEFVKTPNMLLKIKTLWAIPVVLAITIMLFMKAASGKGLIGNFVGTPPVAKTAVSKPLAVRPGYVPPVSFVVASAPIQRRVSSASAVPLPSLASLAPPVLSMGVNASLPAGPANARANTGVINIGDEYWICRSDGSIEKGKLSKHPQYRVAHGYTCSAALGGSDEKKHAVGSGAGSGNALVMSGLGGRVGSGVGLVKDLGGKLGGVQKNQDHENGGGGLPKS